MNKNMGMALAVIIIAGVGYLAFSSEKIDVKDTNVEVQNTAPVTQNQIPPENTEAAKGIKLDSVMGESSDKVIKNPEVVAKIETMAKPGSYEAYSAEKLAFADTGNVVLFFSASWCPSCRALDKNIKESLGAVPSDLKILSVDYDNSKELKQKYGVTTQHTLVQVDKDGNMITKWSGGATLASVVSQLK